MLSLFMIWLSFSCMRLSDTLAPRTRDFRVYPRLIWLRQDGEEKSSVRDEAIALLQIT